MPGNQLLEKRKEKRALKQKNSLLTPHSPLLTPQKGFTLVELMVAISIIAILSTIGMVMFSAAQEGARDARRKGDLEDIKKAMYLLKVSTGSWCVAFGACNGNWQSFVNTAGTGMKGTMKTAFITPGYLKGEVHDPKCPDGDCHLGSGEPNRDYILRIRDADNFAIYADLETIKPPFPATSCLPADPNCCIPNSISGIHDYCIVQ